MGLFGGKREGTASAVTRTGDTERGGSSRHDPPSRSSEGKGIGFAEERKQAHSASAASHGRGAVPPSEGGSMANIGKSIVFKGELSGNEDLVIEGTVEGRIQLSNNQVTIGAEGKITAEIDAKSIVVVGKTAGNLSASERVEVQSTGVVTGDIRSPKLLIQEGAVVNGAIDMSKAPASATRPDSPAAPKLDDAARKSA